MFSQCLKTILILKKVRTKQILKIRTKRFPFFKNPHKKIFFLYCFPNVFKKVHLFGLFLCELFCGFLFFNIVVTILNIFLIVYAYSLNFFPKKWRKKVNQDTIVGLALIFLTMFTGFLWVFYYYFKLIV